MKYARFCAGKSACWGMIEGDEIVELNNSYFLAHRATSRRYKLADVRLMRPTRPSKVVCLGLNYRDHAREMGHTPPDEPCLFIKPDSSVIGPGETVKCPAMSQQVDYEGELGIVIGRALHIASPEDAMRCVLGYTCLNDVTARDLQRKDGQWTRAKGFDTFCPIGPIISNEIDPDNAAIELRLNGKVRQKSCTDQFVFRTAEMISFISHVMTLKPGDVIGTGTPSGIGPMKPGDVVEVSIEGIGTLRNPVG